MVFVKLWDEDEVKHSGATTVEASVYKTAGKFCVYNCSTIVNFLCACYMYCIQCLRGVLVESITIIFTLRVD